jgi:hypothetical protein
MLMMWLLGDNINEIKKNIVTLIDASKEVGLEENADVSSPECRAKSLHKANRSVLKMWNSSDIWERLQQIET